MRALSALLLLVALACTESPVAPETGPVLLSSAVTAPGERVIVVLDRGAGGYCSALGSVRLPTGKKPVYMTYTVNNVVLAGTTYAPAKNHDVTGDSDGTTRTIRIRTALP